MIEELLHPFNSPRPRSSWVVKVGYGTVEGQEEPGVIIEFKSGVFCFYPDTTEDQYEAMISAESWGRQVWNDFYHRPYVIV